MPQLVNILAPTARTHPNANVGLGCALCALLTECGGIYESFDCLTRCCRKPSTCAIACPLSERFGELVTDGGGWGPSTAKIYQRPYAPLPQYIPLIQHGSSRIALLEEPVVALPTAIVFALIRQNPNLDDLQLRTAFRLAPETEIILTSVATDAELEGLWRDMKMLDVPSAIARLRILHVTSPNFSFPISLPRTESLTNRSRIVKASEQLSAAGLSVIMHLNGTDRSDWEYWTDFLRERREITLVAKEFQTGLKSRQIATWHMAQMSILQDRIGRRLGLVAVGGRGALPELTGLDSLTVIDSSPFLKAMNRQVFTGESPWWKSRETPKGAPVDEHLRWNIKSYRAHLEKTLLALRTGTEQQRRAIVQMPDVPHKAVSRVDQGSFWPEMYLPKSA